MALVRAPTFLAILMLLLCGSFVASSTLPSGDEGFVVEGRVKVEVDHSEDVPAGTHLLEVVALGYFFSPVRVDVSSRLAGKIRASYTEGPRRISDSLVIEPRHEETYYEVREPFSLFALLKSPMGMMIGFMVVCVFLLPMLMDSIAQRRRRRQMVQQRALAHMFCENEIDSVEMTTRLPNRMHALYDYVCESPSKQALIQTHRILVKQNGTATSFRRWMFALALLASTQVHWIIVALVALAFLISRRNGVEQEAVVVMPTLGIQLETVYRSKHVRRRFVPLHRILRPVINEAVTPTTCFTYLALLLRDDSKLTLTFLHVRPPLSMLVPIWSSLCAALSHHYPPPKCLLRNS